MKVSASIYSSKKRDLESLIIELDRCHIDYFHIDCNDDISVFEDIAKIRKISNTPIDLHLITPTPQTFFEHIEKHEIELVTIQYEELTTKIKFPNYHRTQWGLAISSNTPVEVFEQYANHCDFILIMTTTPGQSGGVFNKDNFRRIRAFRDQFPAKGIYVDGGVNDETGFILRMLGVTSVVCGSYLLSHQSIGEALLHLKSSVFHSDFKIKDFMIDISEAPHVTHDQLSVAAIIQSIDKGDIGFTIVLDKNEELLGLSSNADVRRGLLQNLDDLNQLKVEDIINTSPVVIHQEASISELLALIQSKKFLISFVPVVSNSQVVGALSFVHLIKSES